jgi:hypothetical protein
MKVTYYGCWKREGRYGSVVKIVDGCEAYVYRVPEKKFVRNDEYLKAMWDPGSDFDEITKEEFDAIVAKLEAKSE